MKGLLDFTEALGDQPKIQIIAKNYIDHLPEDQLYAPAMLNFLSVFTKQNQQTGDSASFMQAYFSKVNAIMKDNYFATDNVIRE